MKVLLLAPPRFYWPFMNEDDNWLLPQSLAYLAAAVRGAGIDVRVLDCMPLRMGWTTLAAQIAREQPDVVAVGENHALYANEALRAIHVAREAAPGARTVLGGSHFSNQIAETLAEHPVDAIVCGEGEVTFVELLREWQKPAPDLATVQGIAFLGADGKPVRTHPRPLIPDLDSLPMPAYDLMPMDLYGRARYLFSPGGTTIHHSRGCVSNCKFCGWWLQMGEVEILDGGRVRYKPRWRTRSVGHTLEEVELLYRRYGKRCLVFVDESWNIDPRWSEEFADRLLERNLSGLNWFAFMRADCLVRDEKAGVLKKLVRSGLRHLCVGVERSGDTDLAGLNKAFYGRGTVEQCFRALAGYPEVFVQATFLVGTREETEESMLGLADYAKKLGVDYPGFHPVTPIPGTPLWDEAREQGWLEVTDFSSFDWLTPVMPSKYLSRDEIAWLLYRVNRRYVTLPWLLKGLFSRGRYKRNMYVWWLVVTVRVLLEALRRSLRIGPDTFTVLRKPSWYDG